MTDRPGPRGMLTPDAARQVAASLRRFADSVRPTDIIGYHDDVGTGEDLADLLDLGASTIERLLDPIDADDGAALIVHAGGRTWIHHPGAEPTPGGDHTPGV